MCDVSGKLIAWMDGELAEQEATDVERHVRGCMECRNSVDRLGEVSRLIVTYGDATVAMKARRKLRLWMPALAGAAAVAALFLLAFRPATVKPAPVVERAVEQAPVLDPEMVASPAKVETVHRHPRSVARKHSNADWGLSDRAVRIVIPAEAMFAPGAVPEGMVFRADLSMASDGSVEGIRLLQ